MDNEQELQALELTNTNIITMAEKVKIRTQDDVDQANMHLKKIATQLKTVDAKMKEFTVPLTTTVKKLKAEFKQATTPLTECKTILTEKVMAYRKIQQSKEKIRTKTAEKLGKAIVIRHDTVDTTNTRKVWKWKIDDIDKVDDQWFLLDEKAINKAVREGKRKIPGIKIYEDEIMVIR